MTFLFTTTRLFVQDHNHHKQDHKTSVIISFIHLPSGTVSS